MMNVTLQDIARQYHKIKTRGWLPAFQREAKRAGTSTAHLLAIGSRETNLENIRGDFRGGIYHGAGVLQVDIGTDPNYVRNWTKENWEPSVVRGTDIYRSKLGDTLKCVGKSANVRSRTFVGKAVEPDDLRRIATAAYNCGRWAHYHFSTGNNVDSSTTGKDYSRDVYDRAIEFAKLLEADRMEANSLRQEIIYQGKYARNSVKSEAGIYYAERVKLPHAPALEESAVVPAGNPVTSTPDNTPEPLNDPATDPLTTIPQNEQPPTTSQPTDPKIVNAPAKENSVSDGVKMAVGGIMLPGFIATIIKVISDLISQGFISAAQIGEWVMKLVSDNQRYVLWLVLAGIAFLALKKAFKQVTLWWTMYIAARKDWNDVEVKPQ